MELDEPAGAFGHPRLHRIAADVGGTFTDIVYAASDGRIATKKVRSTPEDYAIAVVDGVVALLQDLALEPQKLSDVLHGCTVATNAILERKGAVTALVTTKGFRDVLELRRIRMPRLYEPLWRKPDPLVPRHRRLEIEERIGADGQVVVALSRDDLEEAAARIRESGAAAVAVSFLHSYANPDHERRAGEFLRRALPDRFIALSVEVLPEIREYERTSTTVINAYVGPPVRKYVGSLAERLDRADVRARLVIMQSGGGMVDAATVMQQPAQLVECGPAAGVIGAQHLGRQIGVDNLITLDMGGTTTKASIIESGNILRTDEYEVGGGISLSSRLVKGGGYALKTPVIDISEVGAGGGSIVWLDKAGQIKVGPHSAGAEPGPACYARGGNDPTVTDANVILGYLNPEALADGSVPINSARSHDIVDQLIARPLGRQLLETAFGIYLITNATMMRAVKSVSTHRGRDPRDFTLLAFGGNGGVFGVELARSLHMSRVIVPPAAGVFSAVGLLLADVELSLSHAFLRPLDRFDPGDLEDLLGRLEDDIARRLGHPRDQLSFTRIADLRYAGQAFELGVTLPDGALSRDGAQHLAEAFEQGHLRTYGHRFPGSRTVEAVSVRVTGTLLNGARPTIGSVSERPRDPRSPGTRRAYFGPAFGSMDTPVLRRSGLGSDPQEGPLIIEEYEGTTVIPPRSRASLDPYGNIAIDIDP